MATQTLPPPRDWITAEEAAEYLGVHVRTMRRYVREGRVVGRKLGSLPQSPVRIYRPSIETLLPPMLELVKGPEGA